MRNTQLTMNRMRKYQMLVNRKQENQEEGQKLHYKLEGKLALRTQRWRNWVENSWGHKKKYIYKWIRGKKGNGPLIVNNGGSAQMKDIMKLAEETW
eukprot:13893860-Heterocapsa_arctica.AAC.1